MLFSVEVWKMVVIVIIAFVFGAMVVNDLKSPIVWTIVGMTVVFPVAGTLCVCVMFVMWIKQLVEFITYKHTPEWVINSIGQRGLRIGKDFYWEGPHNEVIQTGNFAYDENKEPIRWKPILNKEGSSNDWRPLNHITMSIADNEFYKNNMSRLIGQKPNTRGVFQ